MSYFSKESYFPNSCVLIPLIYSFQTSVEANCKEKSLIEASRSLEGCHLAGDVGFFPVLSFLLLGCHWVAFLLPTLCQVYCCSTDPEVMGPSDVDWNLLNYQLKWTPTSLKLLSYNLCAIVHPSRLEYSGCLLPPYASQGSNLVASYPLSQLTDTNPPYRLDVPGVLS